MLQRVIFLDRDGTLNEDLGYVHRECEWRTLPGVPEAIFRLRAAGFAVVVVSNQSGVGRGLYSTEAVERLHGFVQDELRRTGTVLDAIAYCPHLESDRCDCRKPRTGLARQIEQQLGRPIDYASSWTIGDKLTDIEFGRALGTHTVLIVSRYWSTKDLTLGQQAVAKSLLAASQLILG